ncbi:aminotransferase class V-fold PLP-dependent enzyme [Amycolatopsis anabasis]|uniref:aminotransferase class V-fold PLP-dependent enzyme n=1 Tax=Amycolatopsis anabasis TaxID=1840409 RepID=UPI001FE26A55|nr:aminotransferase class V-fold PLP-dependent enzyme [Amycolatopsis anabasis]
MREVTLRPARFRAHFPVLTDTVHLASCSLGPRSTALDAAMHRMLDLMHADPMPWELWAREVEQARQRFAALIGAGSDEVAVVSGATVAAYQIASTTDWAKRPAVVTTDAEYPSVAQVWAAQRPRGAEVVHAKETACADAVDERAALVSVPLVSYRSGQRMPVAEVTARARAAGARVFVDAYQAAGVLDIDVTELDCDYLVSGSMKYLLGLPGIAFLYVRRGLLGDLPPQLTGCFGEPDPAGFDPLTAPDARRFEVTMPPLPVVLAANAGLSLVEQLDLAAVESHVDRLARRAAERLNETGTEVVPGPQVLVPDPDPAGLSRWLAARRIFLARGADARLSFHYFNTDSDVDTACAAIAEWKRARR